MYVRVNTLLTNFEMQKLINEIMQIQKELHVAMREKINTNIISKSDEENLQTKNTIELDINIENLQKNLGNKMYNIRIP